MHMKSITLLIYSLYCSVLASLDAWYRYVPVSHLYSHGYQERENC